MFNQLILYCWFYIHICQSWLLAYSLDSHFGSYNWIVVSFFSLAERLMYRPPFFPWIIWLWNNVSHTVADAGSLPAFKNELTVNLGDIWITLILQLPVWDCYYYIGLALPFASSIPRKTDWQTNLSF